MEKYVAVINAGRGEVSAVMARWRKNGSCVFEDFARVKSEAFSGGIISDVVQASGSISEVLNKLTEKTGKKASDVYAAVTSASIDRISSSGVVLLSKYGREVRQRDIARCIDIASTVKIPLDKEPLHKIAREFYIDSEKGIKNPMDLDGVKLGVDVNILTINSSVLNNMSKCIAHAGFVPAGFVFSGLASSYRFLNDEDKNMVTAIFNLHKNLTEIMLFDRGTLADCRVFSYGTDKYVSGNGIVERSVLENLYSEGTKLCEWEKVQKIIVAGSGALFEELIEFSEQFFNVPIVAGVCARKDYEELPPERAGYSAPLGVLDYLTSENQKNHICTGALKRFFSGTIKFIDKYF